MSIRLEANKVPDTHAALLDIFKSISNTFDAEAYARLLADEESARSSMTGFLIFLAYSP